MTFTLIILFLVISFILGLVTGILTKGIHVHINHKSKEEDKPTEYNPSSAHNLPPEMVEYAQKNQGYINF